MISFIKATKHSKKLTERRWTNMLDSLTDNATLADGTYIGSLMVNERRIVSGFTKDEIIRWYNAYDTMCDFYEKINSGKTIALATGDYAFPRTETNMFLGYIINGRTYINDKTNSLYLDIVIDDNNIKTVKGNMSTFSDIIRKEMILRFGKFVDVEALIDCLVRIGVKNTFDKDGNVTFSQLTVFQIVDRKIEETLLKTYDLITQ